MTLNVSMCVCGEVGAVTLHPVVSIGLVEEQTSNPRPEGNEEAVLRGAEKRVFQVPGMTFAKALAQLSQ